VAQKSIRNIRQNKSSGAAKKAVFSAFFVDLC
jgi:hypothetical protein